VPIYVALLRGINVGGHRQMAMRDLTSVCHELGFAEVETYLRSGNVVFRASSSSATRINGTLEAAIEAQFGFEVSTLIRTRRELESLVAGNPFLERGAQPDRLHVTFLRDQPARSAVAAIDPDEGRGDTFHVAGREVYLHCPNGYGRSRLTNPFWERRLRTAATTRNWKTINALVDLANR
jgi:uncharacterized protein (DUF1697 family)